MYFTWDFIFQEILQPCPCQSLYPCRSSALIGWTLHAAAWLFHVCACFAYPPSFPLPNTIVPPVKIFAGGIFRRHMMGCFAWFASRELQLCRHASDIMPPTSVVRYSRHSLTVFKVFSMSSNFKFSLTNFLSAIKYTLGIFCRVFVWLNNPDERPRVPAQFRVSDLSLRNLTPILMNSRHEIRCEV